MRAAFLMVSLILVVARCGAQGCPSLDPKSSTNDSASRTLTGKVVFHNDLRQWFSLELDAPVCGQRTVELIADETVLESTRLEVFRGCRVQVTGPLGIPFTGYYSAEIYQTAERIKPEQACIPKGAFPDYSKLKPMSDVHRYRVSMWFNYGSHGTIHATVASDVPMLRPWQPYTHYYLTGGFVFYGYCADGFEMSGLAATAAAKPWMVDNYFALDPESAAEKHVRKIYATFACTRAK